MLHWRKRLGTWARHIRAQRGRVPWVKMALGLLSGPVPAEVWRSRIRTCARCPVKSPEAWVCRRELSDGRVIGCSCDLVMKCLTAAPYARGCYARMLSETEGWPAYVFPTRWAKIRAVWRFIVS